MRYLLILITFSFLFFSCDSIFGPGDSQYAAGVVHKIEMSTWMYGTRTLNEQSGRPIFILGSSSINLDSYINKHVRISGNTVSGYPVDGGPVYLNVTNIFIID